MFTLVLMEYENSLPDVRPYWYEDQLDKEGKGAIKEVLKLIKDNHPMNKGS